MQVNSINNDYKTQPNFKALVLHGNSKQILTKGKKTAERVLHNIQQELSKTKDFDLHVEPLTKDNVYLYWTKKGGKNRIMECSISSYDRDTKGKNVGIYALNPFTYEGDDVHAILKFANEKEANQALTVFNQKSYCCNKSQLQKLSQQAKATLAVENAKKIQLKTFYCWDKVQKNMPKGYKYSYEGKSFWENFTDKLRILFGL